MNSASLADFAARAAQAAKLEGSVNILLTNSREMRALNRRFRGKDQPTDVLSFPAMKDFSAGEAGDLAISTQIARANALVFGHSIDEEVKILVVHGILHLAGYDHEADNGRMARKEKSLRKKFGLPVNLIQRTRSRKSTLAESGR